VRSKDTKPELLLRKALSELGHRYRIHVSTLPGTPDIVFHRKKVAVFVHGCYWHRHSKCVGARLRAASTPEQVKRFNQTVNRDQMTKGVLQAQGWRVHVAWECEIHKSAMGEAIRIERVLAERC